MHADLVASPKHEYLLSNHMSPTMFSTRTNVDCMRPLQDRRNTCRERQRYWPLIVPEATSSPQRIATYSHRRNEDPMHEDPTPEAVSHRQLTWARYEFATFARETIPTDGRYLVQFPLPRASRRCPDSFHLIRTLRKHEAMQRHGKVHLPTNHCKNL